MNDLFTQLESNAVSAIADIFATKAKDALPIKELAEILSDFLK